MLLQGGERNFIAPRPIRPIPRTVWKTASCWFWKASAGGPEPSPGDPKAAFAGKPPQKALQAVGVPTRNDMAVVSSDTDRSWMAGNGPDVRFPPVCRSHASGKQNPIQTERPGACWRTFPGGRKKLFPLFGRRNRKEEGLDGLAWQSVALQGLRGGLHPSLGEVIPCRNRSRSTSC